MTKSSHLEKTRKRKRKIEGPIVDNTRRSKMATKSQAKQTQAKQTQMGKFPELFSKSKTGKNQHWSISVRKTDTIIEGQETAIVTVSYGYEDSKTTVNEKEITKGKNLGKKNETTPYQQALQEAQSTWELKKDKGYAETLSNAHIPGTATTEAIKAHKTISPMLAHDYHKRGKDIKFPCFVQAKLDGVRCIFNNGVLTSRNGKPFGFLDHITKELKSVGLVLDGEIYSTKLSFQEFVGLVKKKTLTDKDKEQLKYVNLWVYDCVSQETYEKRKDLLENFFADKTYTYIHLLPTFECKKQEDLKKFHDRFVQEGNEGLIIRNKLGLYKLATRSADLQKYKEFEDGEYEVVSFTEGEGLEKGLVIWTCKTKDGRQFNVRPRGTHEDRATLFKKASKYVGQLLTVRYQELTTDGIPRFPVGITFRNYE
jgi:DNA ligase-1